MELDRSKNNSYNDDEQDMTLGLEDGIETSIIMFKCNDDLSADTSVQQIEYHDVAEVDYLKDQEGLIRFHSSNSSNSKQNPQFKAEVGQVVDQDTGQNSQATDYKSNNDEHLTNTNYNDQITQDLFSSQIDNTSQT